MNTEHVCVTDQLWHAQDKVSAQILAARQRLRAQIQKEKAILDLLDIPERDRATTEEKSAFIRQRIQHDQAVSESIERFQRFIDDKENEFCHVERRLRFPLGIMRHFRTQNGWDAEQDGEGAQQFLRDALDNSRISTRAPGFAELLQTSKDLCKEVAFCAGIQHQNFDAALIASESQAAALSSRLLAVTEEMAALQDQVEVKKREVTARGRARADLTRECDAWKTETDSNPVISEILNVQDQEQWLNSLAEEVRCAEEACENWSANIESLQVKMRGLLTFRDDTARAVRELSDDLAALEAAGDELSKTATAMEATTVSDSDAEADYIAEKGQLTDKLKVADDVLDAKTSALSTAKHQLKSAQDESHLMKEEQESISRKLLRAQNDIDAQLTEEKRLMTELSRVEKEEEHQAGMYDGLAAEVHYLTILCPDSARRNLPESPGPSYFLTSDPDKNALLARAKEARRRLGFHPSS